MSFQPSDLGEIRNLATALGLINGGGGFQEDWLTKPGDYLSDVLANQAQREASQDHAIERDDPMTATSRGSRLLASEVEGAIA